MRAIFFPEMNKIRSLPGLNFLITLDSASNILYWKFMQDHTIIDFDDLNRLVIIRLGKNMQVFQTFGYVEKYCFTEVAATLISNVIIQNIIFIQSDTMFLSHSAHWVKIHDRI